MEDDERNLDLAEPEGRSSHPQAVVLDKDQNVTCSEA